MTEPERFATLRRMVSDRDIYASAKLLVDTHGLARTLEWCAARQAELRAAGNHAGVGAWIRIEAAARVLADQGEGRTRQ